jgi:23S rRNA (cytosine1962-C5)-methyltransferase
MFSITLKEKREKPVLLGHPWVFSGAIKSVEGVPASGDIVRVVDSKKNFLGYAFCNFVSQITLRMLTTLDEEINLSFFEKRLESAISYREKILDLKENDSYRLIFAESDLLPGLIADKYAAFLVLQFLSAGMEKFKERIAEFFWKRLSLKGIFEKDDETNRKLEGLPKNQGILKGETPPELLKIKENSIYFWIDFYKGQKTGFFLDQKENRKSIQKFCEGKTVLDLFSYSGGFALNALYAQAEKVVIADISQKALELAKKNMELNNFSLEKVEFIQKDAFELLREFNSSQRKFDFIILDPPAFAKKEKDVIKACRGYKDINMLAMKILEKDGVLCTSSCSQPIDLALFQKVIFDASVDAKRTVQIIKAKGPSSDHPVNLSFPESNYLKFLICRVI